MREFRRVLLIALLARFVSSRQGVDSRTIDASEQHYPSRVVDRQPGALPPRLHVQGDPGGLRAVELALICSVSCPGSVIIKTFDAIRGIRDAGIVVAGGFHSPMERECLRFLLRGSQFVVLSPAHGLGSLLLDREGQTALYEGRLIVVSLFQGDVVKATPEAAVRRNELVAAMADTLFVPHAVPGGKAEQEVRRVL